MQIYKTTREQRLKPSINNKNPLRNKKNYNNHPETLPIRVCLYKYTPLKIKTTMINPITWKINSQ